MKTVSWVAENLGLPDPKTVRDWTSIYETVLSDYATRRNGKKTRQYTPNDVRILQQVRLGRANDIPHDDLLRQLTFDVENKSIHGWDANQYPHPLIEDFNKEDEQENPMVPYIKDLALVEANLKAANAKIDELKDEIEDLKSERDEARDELEKVREDLFKLQGQAEYVSLEARDKLMKQIWQLEAEVERLKED